MTTAFGDIRQSLWDFMGDLKPHQRRFCYMGERKVGYVVPVRDSMFRRAWAWVACDMDGTVLGVSKFINEAHALCVARESRRVRQFSIAQVMDGTHV